MTTTPTKTTISELPTSEPCAVCGGVARLVRESAELKLGSRTAVLEVERFRCESCGEITYSPKQMDAAQRALSKTLREQENLLAPHEIKAIRERYRLSQVQLEQLLGVGPKTVVRWECGTVFQNRTTDELLRLIDAIPAAFEFLAAKNGVTPRGVFLQGASGYEVERRYLVRPQMASLDARMVSANIKSFSDRKEAQKTSLKQGQGSTWLPDISRELAKEAI